MPRLFERLPGVFALAIAFCLADTLSAQTACTVQPDAPTSASQAALYDKKFDLALELARRAATESEAPGIPEAAFASGHAELVRTLLVLGRSRDALEAAQLALKRYPDNAVLLDLLGEAHFRRGEISQAVPAFESSLRRDTCSARIHYDIARYNHLNAQFLSESKQLAVAHQLAPHDKAISAAYERSQHALVTKAESIAILRKQLDGGILTDAERSTREKYLHQLETLSKGTCHVAQPVSTATVHIDGGISGTQFHPGGGAVVPMLINGKAARPELDTGASGLTLSSNVARAAGLISEAEVSSYGIGNGTDMTESLAHADSIKIGDLEFRDCVVRIMHEDRVHGDGLIGPDVFSSWVVTIDVPQSQIRLSELPPRLDDDSKIASLDTSGGSSTVAPRNRYTPDAFKTWTPVYRDGHMLIFPTSVNGGPERLFLMDTGAADQGLLSLDAARETTELGDATRIISGVSGTVNKVADAMDVTLTFGHIREKLTRVPAIDLSRMGRSTGADISGLIGFSTLRELIIAIDYRDSLVNVSYDPKHGTHGR